MIERLSQRGGNTTARRTGVVRAAALNEAVGALIYNGTEGGLELIACRRG